MTDVRALDAEDAASLAALLDEVNRSYSRCSEERKKLHEVEWDAGADSLSILGESEVRMNFVVGTVRSWLAGGQYFGDRKDFAARSLHHSATLHSWIVKESVSYPRFAAYLQAIEHLRATAFALLSS
jgi:hypothetical protein